MKRKILMALLSAASLLAQGSQRTVRTITLQYTDPGQIAQVIGPYQVLTQLSSQLKSITISGLPTDVAAAEEAIKRLDIAPKTVELIVYFLVGSDQANLIGATVPADVRDVIGQLKSTFTFKDYRMLDTLTLRTRTGSRADTTGIIGNYTPPRLSQFSIRNITVSQDGGTIRIDGMHAGLRFPLTQSGKTEYMNTGIDQDVDVKEGQKVVVGRSSLEGPEKALFLILTAKVVQ